MGWILLKLAAPSLAQLASAVAALLQSLHRLPQTTLNPTHRPFIINGLLRYGVTARVVADGARRNP
jgi:hypothetical protein